MSEQDPNKAAFMTETPEDNNELPNRFLQNTSPDSRPTDSSSDEDGLDDDDYQNPFYQHSNQLSHHLSIEKAISPEVNLDPDADSRVLSAIAPKIYNQDENHVEISSTPAFQSLEELFQEGKLTGTQVAQLKAKYIELHNTLRKSRENEARLLKESKECLKKLEENHEVLHKADAFPENLTNEVLKLRAQFLKSENDASCSEERLYNLEYKLAGLEEDKQLLDREYARMPKPHELERQIEELKLQNSDLSKEIMLRQEEINDLVQTIRDKNLLMEHRTKEYRDLLDKEESLKDEYVKENSMPNQYMKEYDKFSTEKDDVSKQMQQIEKQIEQIGAELAECEKLRNENEDKKSELMDQVSKEKNASFEKEKEFNDLSKQFELEKEKEVVLLSDKAALELSLKHILADKKLEYDSLMRIQKEKERDTKNLKKLELQLKAGMDSLMNIRLQHEKIMGQKAMQPSNDGSLLEKRKELMREVDALKRELTKEHADTNIQKVKVENRIEVEERLLCEQSDWRIEAVEVTRLAAIKADEKEQKAREFMKAETRYKKAMEDLKVKENLIDEHQKRLRELKIKLQDFAKMYDVIKNERNKCVNQIQICTQRAAEMREKLKILGNEHEILRTSSSQKEKQLQRQRLKYVNSVSLRDSIRNEKDKQKKILEELKEVEEQQTMNIANYNNIVSYNEEESTRLRKRYEDAVKERNYRGLELIKRNEELCVICERSNTQDSIIKNGNIELQTREEESRLLKLRMEEEKRVVGLYGKKASNETPLQNELNVFRAQLVDSQNHLIKLEKQMENCNDPNRIRLLGGPEETAETAIKKLEELEFKLAKIEEQCLEKELVLEQVGRLTERINSKVDVSKDDTLNLAKKVNAIQSSIKDTTKKMMASVSELSIAQARALKLQEEVKTKELLLEQYYSRMEKGEAPSDEMEQEWLRFLDSEERLRNSKIAKQMPEDKIVYTMQDGYVTTAEPRPNAYIPQNEIELPIPKPYGNSAPFKPQEIGANMRHIRKPNPKPIEI
ncbi:coiled-coil domain-containing protein [Brachionus plicatilis]|uniref:Coiled-coil domain-containing protein n=1 Tax=Brachionus plicatilis TaxID=10195 RepID=A0A3M7RDN1_BRAPC|nr:coiled-coil domain-containing protein [Brachionus plicatilis]